MSKARELADGRVAGDAGEQEAGMRRPLLYAVGAREMGEPEFERGRMSERMSAGGLRGCDYRNRAALISPVATLIGVSPLASVSWSRARIAAACIQLKIQSDPATILRDIHNSQFNYRHKGKSS